MMRKFGAAVQKQKDEAVGAAGHWMHHPSTPEAFHKRGWSHLEVAEEVAARLGIAKADARQILLFVICVMFEALVTEGYVKIDGFGEFRVREYPAHKSPHPKTGEWVQMRSAHGVWFRPAAALKRAVNELDDEPI